MDARRVMTELQREEEKQRRVRSEISTELRGSLNPGVLANNHTPDEL